MNIRKLISVFSVVIISFAIIGVIFMQPIADAEKQVDTTEFSKTCVTYEEITETATVCAAEEPTIEDRLITVTYYDVPDIITLEDQHFIAEACEYYNISTELVYQIMYIESNYDPHQVSSTDDHGIMQISRKYYTGYITYNDRYDKYFEDGVNLYNIRHNVILGLRQLNYWRDICYSRGYTDISSILECYNRGFNYFKNTQKKEYSDKVLNHNVGTYEVTELLGE